VGLRPNPLSVPGSAHRQIHRVDVDVVRAEAAHFPHRICCMGIIQVTAAVRNPARPQKLWEGLFLVDPGAVDCMVPGKHLRALGLKPRGKRIYELADGSEVTLDVTVAEVEFMGERVGATVIYGPDDAEPILGVTALESVGIEVDPRSQRLKRLPALRLKSGPRRRRHAPK
jgi:clan AA aspartic protease